MSTGPTGNGEEENSALCDPEVINNAFVAVPTSNFEQIAQQLDLRRFQPSLGPQNMFPTEDDDVDEEIITQCAPPTEIVDTVVTMTTNPDGSLKRTTRRTTRTMVTTTRVRRIKTRGPLPDQVNAAIPEESSSTNQDGNQPPTVFTLIGPRSECQDEAGKSRITQAAFSFMAPTTRTEVTYEKDEHDAEGIESEVIDTGDGADAKSKNRPSKKTVRKTVTSSAASATIVSTGTMKALEIPGSTEDKSLPLLDNMEGVTIPSGHPSDLDGREQKLEQSNKGLNNLAAKSLFFTRSSLESLRKPFSLWGREPKPGDPTMQQLNPEKTSLAPENAGSMEPEDTEQLALRAMKESERLFSEAKMFLPQNGFSQLSNDGSRPTNQVIFCPAPGTDHNELIRFQSRFANLPLYQGYGLIAQQLEKHKHNESGQTNDTFPEPTTSSQTRVRFPEFGLTEWLFPKSPMPNTSPDHFPFGMGFELNAATNALVSMLDESTDRLFKEAKDQLYQSAMRQSSRDQLMITGGLPPLKHVMHPPEDEKLKEVTPPGARPHDDQAYTSADDSKLTATDVQGASGKHPEKVRSEEELPYRSKLSRLGVPTSGAFRVAWSEMPEVLSSDALKKLTRHEIQLQEAMFEVITSEASYYQSLNVLVNHFYHAPEFSCSSSSIQSANPPTQLLSSSPPTMDTALEPDAPTTTGRRPLLKPLEKHHLFSNVLLVCLASEKFLFDLETRWTSQMPILHEVCDLIVKHAGGATFEPYVTYLRNQAYQMETLHKLCQRESFRNALDNLHAAPVSGKNSINSFLALPMQRLTRLKLLVEVIRRLQDAVLTDASQGTGTSRPFRVPTDRERENVQLALRELSRLLASSETEKELMDRKARLLTLSNLLEFPDHVKCVAISDKRLIKEGELRQVAVNGRMNMLQKLSLKKPQAFYFILFNDLLLVTKKKKNERFMVLDYCERAEIHAEIQPVGTNTLAQLPPLSIPKASDSTAKPDQDGSGNEASTTTDSSKQKPSKIRQRAATDLCRVETFGATSSSKKRDRTNVTSSPDRKQRINLGRSGSSLSSFYLNSAGDKSKISPQSMESTRSECIHLVLNTSQSGSPTELHLLPKNSEDFSSWCKALAICPIPLLQCSLGTKGKQSANGKTYHPVSD